MQNKQGSKKTQQPGKKPGMQHQGANPARGTERGNMNRPNKGPDISRNPSWAK